MKKWTSVSAIGVALFSLMAGPAVTIAAASTNSVPATTVVVPPSNFDPLTASDSQLQHFGFPARPTNPSELKGWEFIMSHAKHFIVPKFREIPGVITTTKNAASNNWSGYYAQSSNFTKIAGQWNIPNIGNSNQTSYSANWVGLGGVTNNTQLIQAGTMQNISTSWFGTSTQYYPWWLMLPTYSSVIQITNFPISPGDQFYVHIAYDATNGCADMYLEDITKGTSTGFCAVNANASYNGDTAEWIVERPSINYSLPSLADFGNVYFQQAYAATPSVSQSLGSWGSVATIYNDEMTTTGTTSGTRLAQPGGLTASTAFTDTWYNYN